MTGFLQAMRKINDQLTLVLQFLDLLTGRQCVEISQSTKKMPFNWRGNGNLFDNSFSAYLALLI